MTHKVELYFDTFEPIDSGASGLVLKVQKNNNIFALKLYKTFLLDDDVSNEYNISKILDPGTNFVPKYYQYFEQIFYKSKIYEACLLDFIDGINTEDLYIDDPQVLIHIFLLMSKALQYIHSKNVVHRDIKLGNMIYDQNKDVITIIDFTDASSNDNPREGIRGTIDYISPELATLLYNSEYSLLNSSVIMNIDEWKQSDIWSIGICFYILATNTMPFGSVKKKDNIIVSNIINNKMIPIEEYYLFPEKDKTESVIKTVINMCINRDPLYRSSCDRIVEFLSENDDLLDLDV